jgi:peptide/nickel transport system substrate-binding protein
MRYAREHGKPYGRLEGDLAEHWAGSAEGTVWTFRLRTGQAFDDGSPVDAAAVQHTFERLLRLHRGPSLQFPRDLRVEAVAPLVVRFVLAKPWPAFLEALAGNGAGIINPRVLAQEPTGPEGRSFLDSHSAGSGAFRLVTWERGRALVLKPNPHFGGPVKPVLQEVRLEICHDAQGMRLLLESGALDIAEGLPTRELELLARKPLLTVLEAPSFKVTYLCLNHRRSPLDQVAMRQALSWAVDYSGIVRNLEGGHAHQMRGIIPEGMVGHDPGLLQYGTDMERARELLAALHRPAGLLHLDLVYSDQEPDAEAIASSVRTSLASLGVAVHPVEMAHASMHARVDRGDYELALSTWIPERADPSVFLDAWLDSRNQGRLGNRAFYANGDMDRLLREAAASSDPALRLARYQQAQRLAVQDAVYIYLFQSRFRLAMRKAVQGFLFNPMLETTYNLEEMHKAADH